MTTSNVTAGDYSVDITRSFLGGLGFNSWYLYNHKYGHPGEVTRSAFFLKASPDGIEIKDAGGLWGLGTG